MTILQELNSGVLIGFAVAIPVGPIALLIMRRSAQDGRLAGIVSGLGAATVDLLCGALGVMGLKVLTALMQEYARTLNVLGGLFLIGFGLHTLGSAPPKEVAGQIHQPNLRNAYFTTAILTLANPLTLMGMIFVCAAAGLGQQPFSLSHIAWIATGIFAGSALWWIALSCIAAWLGGKLGPGPLRIVNRVAGLLLVGGGCYQIFQLLRAAHV